MTWAIIITHTLAYLAGLITVPIAMYVIAWWIGDADDDKAEPTS